MCAGTPPGVLRPSLDGGLRMAGCVRTGKEGSPRESYGYAAVEYGVADLYPGAVPTGVKARAPACWTPCGVRAMEGIGDALARACASGGPWAGAAWPM